MHLPPKAVVEPTAFLLPMLAMCVQVAVGGRLHLSQ